MKQRLNEKNSTNGVTVDAGSKWILAIALVHQLLEDVSLGQIAAAFQQFAQAVQPLQYLIVATMMFVTVWEMMYALVRSEK